MKRSGDIASLFQKYESKKKACSQSPSVAVAVPEEQMKEQEDGQDQDRVIEENITPIQCLNKKMDQIKIE